MLLPIDSLNLVLADDSEPPIRQPASYDEPQLARLRARDPQAFDQLVRDQSQDIHRLVSRLLGWDAACDDVVQEVFMTAWIKLDRFRNEASIGTWLYSIAINQCRKVRRKRGRWKKTFQRLCDEQDPNDHKSNVESHSNDGPGTEQSVALIHQAINQLGQRDREIIVLCCLEEKTLDEAGTVLGVRKNTAEVRLHRARKRLKQVLKTKLEEAKEK